MPIKRRYDGPGPVSQRSAVPTMDIAEDLPASHQPIDVQNSSSPKPSTTSRFPTLAQAGPVPQTTQPGRTIPTSSKPIQNQAQAQQWAPQVLQQQPHQQHQRGPQLGYFNAPDRERPILQAASTQPSIGLPDPLRVQRSEMVAYEAQLERDQAMRLQDQVREQHARNQRQRLGEQHIRRQLQNALKSETELQNLSQYEQYSTQGQQPNIVARSRIEEPSSMYVGDMRRGPSTMLYTPRDNQPPRDMGSDSVGGATSGLTSNSGSQLSRTNIMASHVHPDQPVAPRPQPPAVTAIRQQETVRKTSSIMSLLNNDEPTEPRIPLIKRNSDGPPAPVQPSPSPATQQALYPPVRSLSGGQPGQMRRKASIGDMHGPSHSYPRSTASTQVPMRVVESSYSAVVQSQAQSRSQIGSPMDAQPASDRDSYAHQQYGVQRQQQPPSNPQQYQPGQPNHRQMAFTPSNKRTSSPTGQYTPLQASRNNSFEYGHPSSMPTQMQTQMHYSPGPAGPPATMPYQSGSQTHHQPAPVRFAGHHGAPSSQGPLSQPSYSHSQYEGRDAFRPGVTLSLEQQQSQLQLRQQMLLQQQQQQQREEENYQRRLEERRYEDSRRQ